jgi:hypothetical protein
MVRLGGAVVILLASLAFTAPARARDTAECAANYEQAQVLRNQKKLQEAHARLLICADPSCPKAVVGDCTTWLADVERAQPSVVLAAQSEAGSDLVGVKITLDGLELEGDWPGKALSLDPGAHMVRAELEGYLPVEQTVVAHEGEKSRVIPIVMRARAPALASAPPSGEPQPRPLAMQAHTPDAEASTEHGLGWKFYTLLSVSAATGAASLVVGTLGKRDMKDLEKTCSPECSPAKVDGVRTKLIVANSGFAVSGAAAVGALVVWLLDARKADKNAPVPSVGVLPGGGMATLSARY